MNDKLVSNATFPLIQKLTAGIFDEERFTRYIGPMSILNSDTLREVTLKFHVLSMNSADLLVRFFRDQSTNGMEYRRNINITHFRLEYYERNREAILSIMGGIMKENPIIESFEMILLNSYNFLNIN
jgi:hypothetical protein